MPNWLSAVMMVVPAGSGADCRGDGGTDDGLVADGWVADGLVADGRAAEPAGGAEGADEDSADEAELAGNAEPDVVEVPQPTSSRQPTRRTTLTSPSVGAISARICR